MDNAIRWALGQDTLIDNRGLKVVDVYEDDHALLVDKVREYFNENNITYDTFSYGDLIPYLQQ